MLVAFLLVAGCHGFTSRHAPVSLLGGQGGGGVGNSVGISIAVGESVVLASTILRNSSDKVAELKTAELLAKTPQAGATVTDVRIFDCKRAGLYPAFDRWPSADVPYSATAPLPGYRLLPKTQVSLMFIVHSDRKGVWAWMQIRVTFRYGGRTYFETRNNGSRICTHMTDLNPRDLSAC